MEELRREMESKFAEIDKQKKFEYYAQIDDDFRCVNYYLKDKIDFSDFMFDRGNIEQMVFAAQVLSGIDYTNCYINLNVIDAGTKEVIFVYNADAYGIYNLPGQEEWNEKLGITNNESED